MALLESEQMAQAGVVQGGGRERVYDVRRVAVLGAGTMGARIAAHVANAGLPVLLLDMVPATGERKASAVRAMEELKKAKPAAFADASFAGHVRVGNFDDDLEKLKDCDWVIEAVAENIEIKRALLAKVATHLRADAISTTNTSGLPVAKIAEELPEDHRKRWFGTHFFNPPRYMRLVEIIATPETRRGGDRRRLRSLRRSAGQDGGAGERCCRTSLRIASARSQMLNTVAIMKQQGLSIEEIDTLTGPVIGWPKTGTFRLADLVGIDILAACGEKLSARTRDERADVKLPAVIEELVERKWIGDKTKQGFYKKERGADGKENGWCWTGDDGVPACDAGFVAEIEMAKTNDSLAGRIRALLGGNPAKDKVAKFYWAALPEMWAYAANRIGEVAERWSRSIAR